MATDKPRYSITLDDEMFKEIEDFRFEQRFQTRNQATTELIRLGLEAIKKEREKAKKAQKNKPPKMEAVKIDFDPELLLADRDKIIFGGAAAFGGGSTQVEYTPEEYARICELDKLLEKK